MSQLLPRLFATCSHRHPLFFKAVLPTVLVEGSPGRCHSFRSRPHSSLVTRSKEAWLFVGPVWLFPPVQRPPGLGESQVFMHQSIPVHSHALPSSFGVRPCPGFFLSLKAAPRCLPPSGANHSGRHPFLPVRPSAMTIPVFFSHHREFPPFFLVCRFPLQIEAFCRFPTEGPVFPQPTLSFFETFSADIEFFPTLFVADSPFSASRGLLVDFLHAHRME